MSDIQQHNIRSVHRALADPIRLHLLELLWQKQPQSAKELANEIGSQPDRLYYHLAQLEKAKLIEIVEYRPLRGGKVERMYQPTTLEPPGEAAAPHEVAQFLNTSLEATQADVAAASAARASGKRREITLMRATVRLSNAQLKTLKKQMQALVRAAQEQPDIRSSWTRMVFALVDLEDRPPRPSKTKPRKS